MARSERFGETQDVAITILVDNRADLLVRSTETVKYAGVSLLAEHGFSALVDLKAQGLRILWDAGGSAVALPHNMQRLEIDPRTIDKIALSHGHHDHTGAMAAMLRAICPAPATREWPPAATMEEIERGAAGRRVPLVAHPAAFRERWHIRQDGTRVGPTLPPPGAEWRALGADIVLTDEPVELAAGCWTTGYVPRRSFERSGRSATRYYRQDDAFLRDDIEDDQAIVINVRGKGLVVLAGCAHAGIVSTVHYAREISGVERVWAILGGFHLASAEGGELQRTVDEIAALRPALIVPTHCTGLAAMCAFAAQMPQAFAAGVAGGTYLF